MIRKDINLNISTYARSKFNNIASALLSWFDTETLGVALSRESKGK